MKYLRRFKTISEANTEGANGLVSPHLDIIEGYEDIANIYESENDTFTCTFNTDGMINMYNLILIGVPHVTLYGAGKYVPNAVVEVSAVPDEGYEFVSWSDGVTAATRQITMTRSMVLVCTIRVKPMPQLYEIFYTSTDGNVVNPNATGSSMFGANIVSNTYVNGQGIITFDGTVTKFDEGAFSG